MDRARRRELKYAGVLAARQARVDLAATIGILESSGAGVEGQLLAGRLSFAVGALFGAEVGEPEGVRDRLREASGVLSGVLARLSEPGVPRPLDDAGASVAKCLAMIYPARAGLERELEASASNEASGETSLSSPVVALPARDAHENHASMDAPAAEPSDPSRDASRARPKKITSPGVAPPSSSLIPVAQLVVPEFTRPIRQQPTTGENPVRASARTIIRGSDEDDALGPRAPSEGSTQISSPPPALLREATPGEATTFVGRARSSPPSSGSASDRPDAAVPLKRKRKKALELVPDADEGFVDRASGSPMNDGAERRTTERLTLQADIGLHSATQFFTGLTGDVSHGGIFVATWAPLPLGTEVTVSFVLPGGHQITAPGRVAWLKDPQGTGEGEDTPGMGVRFTELSDEDRYAVEGFLARRPPLFHEV